MTDEQINIKIDRIVNPTKRYVLKKRGLFYRPDAAGYTDLVEEAWRVDESTAKQHVYPHDEPVTMHEAPPPNYAADLNACHAAETTKEMHFDQRWIETIVEVALREFGHTIERTDGWDWVALVARLSARQRCEAFLRVHGQWEDGV